MISVEDNVVPSVVASLGVDVFDSGGLIESIEAVLAESEGWESRLGYEVGVAVIGAVRCGRWASRRFCLEEVISHVLEEVMVRSLAVLDWADRHPKGDVWARIMRHVVGALTDERALERTGGLISDRNGWRALRKLREELGLVDRSAVAIPWDVVGMVTAAPPAASSTVELGPTLDSLVDILVEAGVDDEVAVEGTRRVVDLAVNGERDRRHTRARADAATGLLGMLGITPSAAGAWMSLVSGSRRLGVDSAAVVQLRQHRPLSAVQVGWIRRVAAGVEAA